ncbi:MAG: alpha-galactosidase [Clostridia bacterium]|nr:alpha-galactosidase [Clostridia bacterium]
MQNLSFYKNGMHLDFGIGEHGELLLLNLSEKPYDREKRWEEWTANAVEILTTGGDRDGHHGAKQAYYRCPDIPVYVSHEETEDKLIFHLKSAALDIEQTYCFYENVKAVRSFVKVTNIAQEDVGLDAVFSFRMSGFPMDKILIPHSDTCKEMNWQEYAPLEAGIPIKSTMKRVCVSNTGSWSTKEYLPMGAAVSAEQTLLWQVEANGSWNWEVACLWEDWCLSISGPNEQENHWWKNLKPGESFTTVTAAVALGKDFDDAIAQMTKYRRHIAYRSPKDIGLPVMFNDYMGCLGADPTTEKELPQIDAAAAAGAELFIMDAGWYANGGWWDTVGEWKVFEERFPNGMGEVFDYIRAKGMIPGIWLEPEVMGVNCPIQDQFDDSSFFMRHGKRVIDHGRYQLDFRNEKVRKHLDTVVDGLIRDYGIGYFKFDYNIDAGIGTEVNADSFGDGLKQHNDAMLSWLDGVTKRHPDVILENCSSGGMRMDYLSLAHSSLQSLTDAYWAEGTAHIAANSGTAVIPEQAAVWVLPKKEDDLNQVSQWMVNAMFKRIHLSGENAWLSEEAANEIKTGIAYYKETREEIPSLIPFFPKGLNYYDEEWKVCGYHGEGKDYICVTRQEGEDVLEIPVSEEWTKAEVPYPVRMAEYVKLEKGILKVTIPAHSGVVIQLTK